MQYRQTYCAVQTEKTARIWLSPKILIIRQEKKCQMRFNLRIYISFLFFG
jgi:hypothetical protein